MLVRLDSTLSNDSAWTTAPFAPGRLVRCDSLAGPAVLRDESGRELQHWPDPLTALEWLDAERRRTGRRWVGFFAYELGRLFEPKAAVRERSDGMPLFVWCEAGRPASPPADHAGDPGAQTSQAARATCGHGTPPESTFTRDGYLAAVRRCVDYIAAGDVFQINLSQRLSLSFPGSAEALYDALLAHTPAAYGGLIDLGDVAVISNSPELFLQVMSDRRVLTRPIKGTRPVGPGMFEQLLTSEKDAAELNMIVDLQRNDLGRVCEIGSVRVTQPRMIETHPTVFHGVATVEGQLRQDVGLVDLLRATFPGGSITGAPKIRAMQIIDELEPTARGVYCGAVGQLNPDGSLTLNVAIRTMTLKEGTLHIPVGGGIVADSEPEAEYEETLVKARATLAAARRVLESAVTR